MKDECVLQRMLLAKPPSMLVLMENASLDSGLVMETTIVATILTKTKTSALFTLAEPTNSDAEMEGVSSSHGNVTMRMTAEMALTRRDALILLALKESLLVPTTSVFRRISCVMESMTAKTIRLRMKVMQTVPTTELVEQIISSVHRPIFVSNLIGYVMGTMTVETTLMKILLFVLKELALQIVSDVSRVIDASLPHGIVMVMTIVETSLMNQKNTARVRREPASETSSLVTMEIVSLVFTSVMETTTV
jgi:hypothetical protein